MCMVGIESDGDEWDRGEEWVRTVHLETTSAAVRNAGIERPAVLQRKAVWFVQHGQGRG